MNSFLNIGFNPGTLRDKMRYEVRDATPEEFQAWRESDYWNKMDFDPLVMFVVIPTIIQLACLGMMGAVMLLNSYIF